MKIALFIVELANTRFRRLGDSALINPTDSLRKLSSCALLNDMSGDHALHVQFASEAIGAVGA